MSKFFGFIILTVIVFSGCEAQMTTTTTTTTTTTPPSTNIFQNVSVIPSQIVKFTIPGGRLLGLLSLFTSLKQKFGGQDGFVGRCFGAARKLKLLIPFFLYKLGVITTTLGFLVLFTLKGLAIGILLLILNAGGWLAKIGFAKGQSHGWSGHGHGGWSGKHSPPVHIHVHKDRNDHHSADDGYISYSPPPGYGSSYDSYDMGYPGRGSYGSAKYGGSHGVYGPYGRGPAIGTSSGPDYEPSAQSWAERLSKGFNVGDLLGGEQKRSGHALAFPARATPSDTQTPTNPIR